MKSGEVKYSYHYTGLYRHWGFQEAEALKFPEIRHMKLRKLSALDTSRLYTQEIFMVIISIIRCVDPRAIVRPTKIYNDTIGNQTHDLPTCSAVPSTAPGKEADKYI